MAAATIIRCPNCGTRNRVPPTGDGVPRCSVCRNLLPWIVDAGDQDYDSHLSVGVPVLVDFWAPWCGPCKWVAPVVDELAEEHAGRLKVVRVNVDEAPAVAERYGIRGIPTLALFENGKELDRLTGAAAKPQLEQWLEGQLRAHGQPA
jgi:thioredoxin 2